MPELDLLEQTRAYARTLGFATKGSLTSETETRPSLTVLFLLVGPISYLFQVRITRGGNSSGSASGRKTLWAVRRGTSL